MLQQEAYLLFYIRDRDYKPTNVPFPPGSPALKLQSSSHFKADPNFLGRSNKQFTSLSSSQRAGLDKTGTPLVRLKPTGVVQPSPQKDTPGPPKPPLPAKGQSSSPPVPTSGGLVTPKSKSVSPNSSGGSGNGVASPMMRDFSIPLRKISNTSTPSRTGADKTAEATRTSPLPHPPPPTGPQQQATPTATTSLQFTPRQISAPPSRNKKKIAIVKSASLNRGAERTSAGEKEAVSGASEEGIQTAPSIASQSATSDKIASRDDESAVLESSESKGASAFKAIRSEEPPMQGGFIGPQLPSSPTPTLPQSPLRVTPCSLQPATTSPVSSKAVAMVPPQPQAREKPVARVRPNPHRPEDEESMPRTVTSKESGSLASTPAPHLNAVSPWKVREPTAGEVFGPALPQDLDYNSAAHGWNVSAISGGEEAQEKGERQATPREKAKKHKKKKKHRKREEGASDGSEGERGGGGKRERSKESSGKKVRSRDERGRRHHSHSPDRGYHHHDSHRTPERTPPHYDKYRKYKKYSYRDRDRDREASEHHRRHKQHSKGNSRYSHHDRSRSHSRSRSRSPLNHDSEDRYHHHNRDRYRTSPSRHAHQHHHHAPYSDVDESGGGHWRSYHQSPHHRPKHTSDSSERRVNIKSDEVRRRERKRSHHHDPMSEDEGDRKKHKKSMPSGK